MDYFEPEHIIALLVVAFGGAVAWGMLRQQVAGIRRDHDREVARFDGELDRERKRIEAHLNEGQQVHTELGALREAVDRMTKTIEGLAAEIHGRTRGNEWEKTNGEDTSPRRDSIEYEIKP